MPLKAKIAKIEDVEETLQPFYRQLSDDSGAFVLDVTEVDGYTVENIAGLKSTLQSQKTVIQSNKDKLELWGDKDPDDVTTKLNRLVELEALDPEALAVERVNAAVSTHKAQFKTAISEKDSVIDELNGAISGLMIDSVAMAALSEAKGEAKLLLPHIKTQCKVSRNDDGTRVVHVLDPNGNARIALKDGNSRDFTITDLVEEMRSDDTFGLAFETKVKSGQGGPSDHPRKSSEGVRSLSDASHDTISANLEDIADGKAEVAAM